MNDNPSIVIIVEGDGEVEAAPSLIRRILWERLFRYDIPRIKSMPTNSKSNLLKRFEQFLEYAIGEDPDAILALVDADDDECPVEEARDLANRASALNLGVPVAVVYAKSEYETWFISSLSEGTGERIRAMLNIASSVIAPEDVEGIRGAKEWLEGHMPQDQGYKETSDQENLTHHIDMELTHSKSRSFRRLCHAVEELVGAIDESEVVVTPMLGGEGRTG